MASRHVSARWDGGQAATTEIRGMRFAIGEDAPRLGTTSPPLPTEVLLAAVASCFAIALGLVAARRNVDLSGLWVDVTADYDGPRITRIGIDVHTRADPEVVARLIPPAQRVCYVTNTLQRPPEISISQSDPIERTESDRQ